MRYKKFILIPVILFLLIVGYMKFVDILTSGGISTITSAIKQGGVNGIGENVGVGEAVSFQVTRLYLFGLVRLPLYAPGIGEISGLNALFFWSLIPITILLTAGFVIIERSGITMPKTTITAPKISVSTPRFSRSNIWIRLGKAIGIGALFALLAVLLSNGDALSLVLGLLVAYLEFRMF